MSENKSLDSVQESSLKVTNTTFSDEIATIHVEDRVIDESVKRSRSAVEDSVKDQQWSLKMMFAKPRVIKTLTFSTSDSQGAAIGTFSVFNDLLADVGSMQNSVVKSYSYFRGNPHFRFVVNATKFHVGRLMAFWVPLKAPLPTNVFTASGYQHCLIDMANNSPVEFTIPFFHKYGMVNMLTNDDSLEMGTLYVTVLNPLLATTGVSASVDITVFAWIDDMELRFPVDSAVTRTFTPLLRNHRLCQKMETQGLFDIFGDLFESGKKVITGVAGGLEKTFDGDFGGAFEDFGQVVSTSTEFVDKHPEVLEMLFDRPINSQIELKSKRMCFSSMSYGIGPDTVTRLGLNPHGLHIPSSDVLSGHVNDSMISKIVSTPMLFRISSWASTMTPGTQITTFKVNPTWLTRTESTNYLAYVSDAFEYWRGSIDVRLDVVASQFHSGRMLVVFLPGASYTDAQLDAFTLDEALISPNIIIDLSNTENRSYSFSFPYVSNRPWLNSHYVKDGLNAGGWDCYSGMAKLFVLNALTHPDNVSNSISINMYVAAGSDFQLCQLVQPVSKHLSFDFPPTNNPAIDVADARTVQVEQLELQGLDTAVEGLKEMDMLQVTEKKMDIDSSHFFNEFSNSLCDVVRRYGRAWNRFTIGLVSGENNFSSEAFPVSPIAYRKFPYSPLAYFSKIFLGWSGSIRYKILSTAGSINSRQLIVVYLPNDAVEKPQGFHGDLTDDGATWSDLLQRALGGSNVPFKVHNLAYEPCVEIEIPYTRMVHFVENYNSSAWTTLSGLPFVQNGTLNLVVPGSGTSGAGFQEALTFDIFQAAGDDFCFHYLIPPTSYDIGPFPPP